MSALAEVVKKRFNIKFILWKLIHQTFYVTIADVDIEGLKSLPLFGKYLDHIMLAKFENRMVDHFWQSVDTILEDVSLTATIF